MPDIELVIKIPKESYEATCNSRMLPPDIKNVVNAIKQGTLMNEEKEILTADERADVLNAVNEVLEKFGLEVCGYKDDGTFFDIQVWRR